MKEKSPRIISWGFLIFWCPWQESNLRPSGPQPDALSTELQGLLFEDKSLYQSGKDSTKYAGISPLCQQSWVHEFPQECIDAKFGE